MVSEKILSCLESEALLIKSPIHGLHHWRTVERNGLYLAQFTGADKEVISLFGHFHDCMRENEGRDIEHGPRATTFLRGNRYLIPLDDECFEMLCVACSGHTFGRTSDCVTVATCWDADRLDLDRVGIQRDPKYFRSDEAQRIVREGDDAVLHRFAAIEKK
ncbi:MAG: hypothetical protein COB53_09540 [Elusimicrobia bacterium]|nr:MAG: hypothetical protein COB53_09540 [Elusimicrobiota bacterium]